MKIDLKLFLSRFSHRGLNINQIDVLNLDAVPELIGFQFVMLEIFTFEDISEKEIDLVYGLSCLGQPHLAVLFSNMEGKLIGIILPDDLSDLKVTYEASDEQPKELGVGATSRSWPPLKPLIYRCPKDDQHPRFAYLQKGAKKPGKCIICQRKLVQVKAN